MFCSRRSRSCGTRPAGKASLLRGFPIAEHLEKVKKLPAKVSPFPPLCLAHYITFRAPKQFIQSCCRVLYRSPSEAQNATILTMSSTTTTTTEIICESAPPSRRTSGTGTDASPRTTVRFRRENAAGAEAAVALHLRAASAISLRARHRRSRTQPASSTAVGRLTAAAATGQAPR